MNRFSEQLWEKLSKLWYGNIPEQLDPEEEELETLLKDQFLIRQAMRREADHTYDINKAWENVVLQKRNMRRIILRTARYAAIVALLVSGLVYFFSDLTGKKEGSGHQSGFIIPGSAKAELLLSSGEKILLNEQGTNEALQQKGILLVNDTVSGRLQYNMVDSAGKGHASYNTLYVPKGGEYQLELPDGTVIWVNSESSVRFPERFSRTSRDVYLDGEAYFKVAKNDACPFRVHIGDREIEVVGTTFNVSAYNDDVLWHTTLVEGAILIGKAENKIQMKPSERLVLNRLTQREELQQVNSRLYTSWVDGKFYFIAYTFEEIVKKLERWYDFQMIYTNKAIKTRIFTGFVNKHEPIEEMLMILELTTDIQFSIKNKTITVSIKPK